VTTYRRYLLPYLPPPCVTLSLNLTYYPPPWSILVGFVAGGRLTTPDVLPTATAARSAHHHHRARAWHTATPLYLNDLPLHRTTPPHYPRLLTVTTTCCLYRHFTATTHTFAIL